MRAPADKLTARLSEYVATTSFNDLPPVTITGAKTLVLDTVACTLAAARFPVGRLMIDHVRGLGGCGGASVWPSGFATSAPLAAYANGHLANALDFDASLHIDTHVLPAAVATAEYAQVDGKTLLVGYIVGREVGVRLMRAMDGRREQGNGVTYRGWWHPGLVGPIDAGFAASRILDLDAEATTRAIGIASCSVGGFRRNLGTMAKSIHSGKGARDGVHAAMLAKVGVTSEPAILESPMGMIETLCEKGDFDYGELFDGLGQRYDLQSPPKPKPYPACGPANPQIDSVLELLAARNFAVEDIERVIANVHPHSLFRTEARSEVEAGFSTPYIIAATFVDGEFGLEQLGEGRRGDHRIRDLAHRVEHDASLVGGRIRVVLRDGRELAAGSDSRRALASWDEVVAKFHDCAGTQLAPGSAEEFVDRVAHLQDLGDVRELFAVLRRAVRVVE